MGTKAGSALQANNSFTTCQFPVQKQEMEAVSAGFYVYSCCIIPKLKLNLLWSNSLENN